MEAPKTEPAKRPEMLASEATELTINGMSAAIDREFRAIWQHIHDIVKNSYTSRIEPLQDMVVIGKRAEQLLLLTQANTVLMDRAHELRKQENANKGH